MGAQELTRKIIADARQRAEALKAEGRAAAASVKERAAAEQAKLAEESRRQTEREAGPIVERARSAARLDRQKRLLAARWQVIDRAVEQAGQAVVKDPSYPDILVALARRHAVPGATLHFSESDTRLVRGRGVEPGEPVAIRGGLLVRQGKVVLNLSLDELLVSVRNDLASELAKVLFPE